MDEHWNPCKGDEVHQEVVQKINGVVGTADWVLNRCLRESPSNHWASSERSLGIPDMSRIGKDLHVDGNYCHLGAELKWISYSPSVYMVLYMTAIELWVFTNVPRLRCFTIPTPLRTSGMILQNPIGRLGISLFSIQYFRNLDCLARGIIRWAVSRWLLLWVVNWVVQKGHITS